MIKSDDEKDELNKEDKRIKNNKITEKKKKNSFVANIEKNDNNKNMKAYLIEKKKFCWKS